MIKLMEHIGFQVLHGDEENENPNFVPSVTHKKTSFKIFSNFQEKKGAALNISIKKHALIVIGSLNVLYVRLISGYTQGGGPVSRSICPVYH